MTDYSVAFAGSSITIACETAPAQQFAAFLFADLRQAPDRHMAQLMLAPCADNNEYQLARTADNGHPLFRGSLGVGCAATIFDAVIYQLLDKATGGMALHAGAVCRHDRTIIIPGPSGAGKSTLVAWLVAHGFTYLTDELLFLSDKTPADNDYFTRPICLKSGSVSLITGLLTAGMNTGLLEEPAGALIPHRLLNPEFTAIQSPPDLILVPDYRPGAPTMAQPISPARLTTILMGCHVNARNLNDHGFRQMVRFARSTPAYRLTYDSLDLALNQVEQLLAERKWQ